MLCRSRSTLRGRPTEKATRYRFSIEKEALLFFSSFLFPFVSQPLLVKAFESTWCVGEFEVFLFFKCCCFLVLKIENYSYSSGREIASRLVYRRLVICYCGCCNSFPSVMSIFAPASNQTMSEIQKPEMSISIEISVKNPGKSGEI